MTVKFPAAILAAALTLAACSDGPTAGESPMQRLAGSYAEHTFTITESGRTTNLQAQGASLDIVLDSSGTTSGRLVVPGVLDASMAGTWTLKADTVRFNQTADTFVRDMPFLLRAERLVGIQEFDGARIDVTLARL